MTALQALKDIKKLIEDEVASKVKLQKEKSNPAEYVHPYVALLSMPHKNFIPSNCQVPYIMIGVETESDDGEEHELNVLIQFATFGGGYYDRELMIPDDKSTIDLLNVIELTKQALLTQTVIGSCSVDRPMTSGIYSEMLTYPYSYGYLAFKVQLAVFEYPMYRNVLDF